MTPPTSSEEQQFLEEFDKKLWTAAVYKHAALGLLFLKFISNTFDLRREVLESDFRDPKSYD